MEIGVNLSPLFASAGVVGLAIGFGAQTLVRDIFLAPFICSTTRFVKVSTLTLEASRAPLKRFQYALSSCATIWDRYILSPLVRYRF